MNTSFQISQNDAAMYRDMYRDVTGIRPSNYQFASQEEFDREINYLSREIERQIQEETVAEAKAWEAFQARVAEIIQAGASDHSTAVRWMIEADKVDHDRGYFLWINGLSSKRWEAVFGEPLPINGW